MNLIRWNSYVMLKQKHNRICNPNEYTPKQRGFLAGFCGRIFISFNPYHWRVVTSPKGEIKILMKSFLHLNDSLCSVFICLWNWLKLFWKHVHSRVKSTIVSLTCLHIHTWSLPCITFIEIFLTLNPYFSVKEKWSLFNFNF